MLTALIIALLFFKMPDTRQLEPEQLPKVRAKVLQIARAELGQGETRANNDGAAVLKYTKGKRAPWCMAFASYTLERAGVNRFGYTLNVREFFKRARRQGMTTDAPQPGDIAIFWRDDPQGSLGHVGIIERVTDQTLETIEGNRGKFPAVVKRVTYKRDAVPCLLGYVKIN